MSRISFKPGTFLYPLPAVMVTSGNFENANVMTVAWTGIICSDPAMTYISVRKERYSYDLIKQNMDFVRNVMRELEEGSFDYEEMAEKLFKASKILKDAAISYNEMAEKQAIEEAFDAEIVEDENVFEDKENLKKRKIKSRKKAAKANKYVMRKKRKHSEDPVMGYGYSVYARTKKAKAFVKRNTRRATRRMLEKQMHNTCLEEELA